MVVVVIVIRIVVNIIVVVAIDIIIAVVIGVAMRRGVCKWRQVRIKRKRRLGRRCGGMRMEGRGVGVNEVGVVVVASKFQDGRKEGELG